MILPHKLPEVSSSTLCCMPLAATWGISFVNGFMLHALGRNLGHFNASLRGGLIDGWPAWPVWVSKWRLRKGLPLLHCLSN